MFQFVQDASVMLLILGLFGFQLVQCRLSLVQMGCLDCQMMLVTCSFAQFTCQMLQFIILLSKFNLHMLQVTCYRYLCTCHELQVSLLHISQIKEKWSHFACHKSLSLIIGHRLQVIVHKLQVNMYRSSVYVPRSQVKKKWSQAIVRMQIILHSHNLKVICSIHYLLQSADDFPICDLNNSTILNEADSICGDQDLCF